MSVLELLLSSAWVKVAESNSSLRESRPTDLANERREQPCVDILKVQTSETIRYEVPGIEYLGYLTAAGTSHYYSDWTLRYFPRDKSIYPRISTRSEYPISTEVAKDKQGRGRKLWHTKLVDVAKNHGLKQEEIDLLPHLRTRGPRFECQSILSIVLAIETECFVY